MVPIGKIPPSNNCKGKGWIWDLAKLTEENHCFWCKRINVKSEAWLSAAIGDKLICIICKHCILVENNLK